MSFLRLKKWEMSRNLTAPKRQTLENLGFQGYVSGPDGTRTRDPMRDRHVF